MLEDRLLEALGFGGGGWEDGWRMETVAGGLNRTIGLLLDTVGSDNNMVGSENNMVVGPFGKDSVGSGNNMGVGSFGEDSVGEEDEDSTGSREEEGDGLVDAHGGRVSCCWADPSLFGTVFSCC
jgi:hypothetical protein